MKNKFNANLESTLNENNLTGRFLMGNVFWNLFGQLIPAIFMLLLTPLLIRGMGEDRFGILALAWATVGYFSFFDLGLGSAVTQLVADGIARKEEVKAYKYVWNAFWVLTFSGVVAGVLLFLSSPLIVSHLLKVDTGFQNEGLRAFRVMAFGLPLVMMSNVLNGVLTAHHWFKAINLVAIPQGILNLLGPLLVLTYTKDLGWIVFSLVLVRFIGMLCYGYFCFAWIPGLKSPVFADRNTLKRLLGFGGWMTIENIIGPTMVTFDRYVIASMVSIAAVTYYVVPYQVITKLWLLSAAVMKVLFPAFSASHQADPTKAQNLYKTSIKYLFLIIFIPAFFAVVWAPNLLNLWLGKDFSNHSYMVMQILGVGIFVNVPAQVIFAYLQGMGRPDLIVKRLLFEMLAYYLLLVILLNWLGIVGAAWAWAGRILLDDLLLFGILEKQIKPLKIFHRQLWMWLIFVVVVSTVSALVPGFLLRTAVGVFCLTVTSALIWFKLYEARDRTALIQNMTNILKEFKT